MNVFFLFAAIILLLALNGLFVAAEFAAISAKKQRLAQMADNGNQLARKMLEIAENPHKLDLFVSTCQLGITVTSLALGSYGQSQIIALITPLLQRVTADAETVASTVATVIVLLVLTILQVILSELAPKNISLRHAERMALLTGRPMLFLQTLFRPLIAVLNGCGALILRLLGQPVTAEHSHVHSPEEIMMLLEQSDDKSQLDQEERELLVNTLALRNLRARHVMIPRNRLVAASVDENLDTLFQLLAQSRYSRLPLYEGSVDNIVGMVHLKDLLLARHQQLTQNKTIIGRLLLHPTEEVPDTLEIQKVMDRMQRNRRHLAIVVDEYGGTAGLLTFEDLIEEIIGEFRDEFDKGELVPYELRNRNELWLRGDLQLAELNDLLDIRLSTEESETVGGLILERLGRVPEVGERIEVAETALRVERMIGKGVVLASMLLTPEQVAQLTDQPPPPPPALTLQSNESGKNITVAPTPALATPTEGKK